MARVQKTNVHAEAIESSLKDVVIGRVPDRGGRVDVASGASKLEAQGARRDAAVAVKYVYVVPDIDGHLIDSGNLLSLRFARALTLVE